MEKAPENGKESPHSAHANGMKDSNEPSGTSKVGNFLKIKYQLLREDCTMA